MKIIQLFILHLVFFKCYGQSNARNVTATEYNASIKCQYKLTYKPDSTSNAAKEDLFFLFLGKAGSLFREQQALAHDSLLASRVGLPFNQHNFEILTAQLKTMTFPSFTYSIYKNQPLDNVFYCDKIGQTSYSYSESTPLFNWHITPEKVAMDNYSCQKATAFFAGRLWEAWFTREIPFSDGPYKFTGLPGLIIKVCDSRKFYIFELIKLQEMPVPQIVPLLGDKLIKTTKQMFLQGKADYEAGAVGRMVAMGNAITDAQKQSFKERAKKRNNPLELK